MARYRQCVWVIDAFENIPQLAVRAMVCDFNSVLMGETDRVEVALIRLLGASSRVSKCQNANLLPNSGNKLPPAETFGRLLCGSELFTRLFVRLKMASVPSDGRVNLLAKSRVQIGKCTLVSVARFDAREVDRTGVSGINFEGLVHQFSQTLGGVLGATFRNLRVGGVGLTFSLMSVPFSRAPTPCVFEIVWDMGSTLSSIHISFSQVPTPCVFERDWELNSERCGKTALEEANDSRILRPGAGETPVIVQGPDAWVSGTCGLVCDLKTCEVDKCDITKEVSQRGKEPSDDMEESAIFIYRCPLPKCDRYFIISPDCCRHIVRSRHRTDEQAAILRKKIKKLSLKDVREEYPNFSPTQLDSSLPCKTGSLYFRFGVSRTVRELARKGERRFPRASKTGTKTLRPGPQQTQDSSVLRPGINKTVTGMKQALRALEDRSIGIRHDMFHEYECGTCLDLVRSLADLTSHNRSSCRAERHEIQRIYWTSPDGSFCDEIENMSTVIVGSEEVETIIPEDDEGGNELLGFARHDLSRQGCLGCDRTSRSNKDERLLPCYGPSRHAGVRSTREDLAEEAEAGELQTNLTQRRRLIRSLVYCPFQKTLCNHLGRCVPRGVPDEFMGEDILMFPLFFVFAEASVSLPECSVMLVSKMGRPLDLTPKTLFLLWYVPVKLCSLHRKLEENPVVLSVDECLNRGSLVRRTTMANEFTPKNVRLPFKKRAMGVGEENDLIDSPLDLTMKDVVKFEEAENDPTDQPLDLTIREAVKSEEGEPQRGEKPKVETEGESPVKTEPRRDARRGGAPFSKRPISGEEFGRALPLKSRRRQSVSASTVSVKSETTIVGTADTETDDRSLVLRIPQSSSDGVREIGRPRYTSTPFSRGDGSVNCGATDVERKPIVHDHAYSITLLSEEMEAMPLGKKSVNQKSPTPRVVRLRLNSARFVLPTTFQKGVKYIFKTRNAQFALPEPGKTNISVADLFECFARLDGNEMPKLPRKSLPKTALFRMTD